VDDGIHAAQVVYLTGEPPGLSGATQVADDDAQGPAGEVGNRTSPLSGACMEHDIMTLVQQGSGGQPA